MIVVAQYMVKDLRSLVQTLVSSFFHALFYPVETVLLEYFDLMIYSCLVFACNSIAVNLISFKPQTVWLTYMCTNFKVIPISGLPCRYDNKLVFFNANNRSLLYDCLSDLHQTWYMIFIYLFLLSIFVNDRGHTKGISLYRVLPHKNYTQHTTIPNKQLQKQIHTQTIRRKLQKIN